MNDKQKKVLIAVIVVMFFMLVFPPFHVMLSNGTVRNLGYSFILNPASSSFGTVGTVDIGLLVTQWFGVLIIGTISFFLFKDRK